MCYNELINRFENTIILKGIGKLEMIEKAKKLIEDDEFEKFKDLLNSNVFNSHHRMEIYKHAFFNQKERFIDFLYAKVNLNKEIIEDILVQSNQKGVQLKKFEYMSDLNDMRLFGKIEKRADLLVKSQNDDFLIKFHDAYPISTMLNFKKIIFNSFKYEKNKFLEHATKNSLDMEMIFYIGLCSIKFNKEDFFGVILENQIKQDPDLTSKLKSYSDNYVKNFKHLKTGIRKEEIEEFIDKKVIEGFAIFLNQTLKVKDSKPEEVKRKKMKI